MAFFLTALGAGLAVALELAEASAIVLAVGVSRSWRDAFVGAAAGGAVCALLAAALGPGLLNGLAVDSLRAVIGVLLILFGLEWLRKGVLRLGGRKQRSSSFDEFQETEDDLAEMSRPARGERDWAARAVAFKGVLLEGVEVVLIVSVLAARPEGPTPALVGTGAAFALTIGAAALLRRPLARIPETELKFVVGVLLTAFGAFFFAEGLGGGWPGGDAALAYSALVLGGSAWIMARALSRREAAAP